MLDMPKINDIRDLYRKGMSIQAISRKVDADRKTVMKYIAMEDFSPKPPTKPQRVSILDPYKETVIRWLEEDRDRWYKQRHTARRIFERLQQEEGYEGSYSTVRRFVHNYRQETLQEESYGELIWEPGCAQCDFGEADFYEFDKRVRRPYFVMTFPYSNMGFVQVFRAENAECVCQGLLNIFQHIQGVPHRIIFDNAAGVGKRINKVVNENELFLKFKEHFKFVAEFCNPYAGHEKGNVENKVGAIRRNYFVPEPHYTDLSRLNRELLAKSSEQMGKMHYKKNQTYGTLFADDRKHFIPLNPHPFEVVRYLYGKTDKYGKVQVDGPHFYATIPEEGRKTVIVGLGAEDVTIYDLNQTCLASHRREYGSQRTDSRNPWSTLRYLQTHPRAWQNSALRLEMADPLKEQIDQEEAPVRQEIFKNLEILNQEYEPETSCQAVLEGLKQGKLNLSGNVLLAKRITEGGLDLPPSPGPNLESYDLLLRGKEGER